MKRSFLLFTIVLLSSQAYSQSGWVIQTGGYDPNGYCRDVFFMNSQTGWILISHKVMYTINGGFNWTDYEINPGENYPPGKIFFVNSNTGWISGRRILKTTNSGVNWILLDSVAQTRGIFFYNELSGWACGFGGMLKRSSNGGSSWISIQTGYNETFNSVYFLNSLTGFIAAEWGKILRTTNGGLNWTAYTDSATYSFMQSIEFLNDLTGFVCGTGGYIYKTSNGGENWTQSNTGSYAIFSDISFSDSQNGLACGNSGIVCRTTNGGSSWVQVQSAGLYANTYALDNLGGGNVWLVADSSLIYNSTDFGASWLVKQRLFITHLSLRSISFFNENTGIACGESGVMLRTTNGGTNWSKINSGTNSTLNTLCIINQSTGFAAGGSESRNQIVKTVNSGSSWSPVVSDSTLYINSIFFVNQQTGWCGGAGGNSILKTTNQGQSWTRIVPSITIINVCDIWFTNENTGYLLRQSGSGYYFTTDGGVTWAFKNPFNITGNTIQFVNLSTGFVLTNSASTSTLFKTTNSGINWEQTAVGPATNTSLYFINENKGWISGTRIDNYVKYSANSGTNWVSQPVNSRVALNSIYFINETKGWACGGYGTILHTSNGGIGIDKISSNVPGDFILHQNFPNPFNPTTKVRFVVSYNPEFKTSIIEIKIYDILGREVSILLAQALLPGTYEVDFDGTGYPSGVYFCRLSAGKFSETIKMILLK